MKIYVAARFSEKKEVLRIYKLLREKGHTIIADWTLHKNIDPYDKNQAIAKKYAIEDIEAVTNSDVFILLTSAKPGLGSTTELGAAIASNELSGKPKIYVLGTHMSQNFCYFHPSVNRFKTIKQLLDVV